ncbi:MAG TPA: methyl-accepting chemotaxis protein [Nostocaceae cyanobacterium]|nr:methyl-accepting chemotaxis protein [Nostocaceae cyanobacterium]
MNFQLRLITSFSFVGTIVFFVGLVGWNSSFRLSDHINTLSNNIIPTVDTVWDINEAHTRATSIQKSLVRADLTTQTRQKIYDDLQATIRRIDEKYKTLQSLPINNEEEKQLREKLDVSLNKWKDLNNQFLALEERYHNSGYRNSWEQEVQLLRQGQGNSPEIAKINQAKLIRNQLNKFVTNEIENLFVEVDTLIFDIIENNRKFAADTRKTSEQDVIISNILITIGIILGPFTAIIFGIIISRQISMPVTRVVSVAEEISKGDLRAEITAESHRKDEISKLMTAFHAMIKNLNSLILRVQHSVIQVTSSTTQIAASGKQLQASISEQLASTNQVTAATKEISATSQQLVRTVEEVTMMSQKTTIAANDSQKDLHLMAATMQQLLEATNSIAGRLGVISEKANSINNIVVTITKVADQTNLLSLNAAIEAEKAGEYGLGFAVVAREIRRLADQTAVATIDIEQMVKQMQSSVSTGVMEMDKFASEVSKGVENVGYISSKLGQIIEQVQDLTPRFEIVNEGMENQSLGARQISEAMSQLSQNSMQTAASLQEINQAITSLNEVTQGLHQEISFFKLNSVVEKSIKENRMLLN